MATVYFNCFDPFPMASQSNVFSSFHTPISLHMFSLSILLSYFLPSSLILCFCFKLIISYFLYPYSRSSHSIFSLSLILSPYIFHSIILLNTGKMPLQSFWKVHQILWDLLLYTKFFIAFLTASSFRIFFKFLLSQSFVILLHILLWVYNSHYDLSLKYF